MASHQIAQGIAQLGRNGDSTLVHMQPHEVAGLQALAKSQGTSLTINPDTGLPEAFSLGGFFKSLLPTIVGFGAAGISGGAINPLTAGMIAGAGTGALLNKKDPLMGAAMGGLGGYGGAGLYNVGAAMPGQAANFETSMGLDKAYSAGQGAQAATKGFENSMGLANAYNAGSPAMANIANTAGMTTSDMLMNPGTQQALQNQSTNALQQGLGRVASSAGNLADVATFKPGAFDAFSAAGGTMMKAAMPLGGAVLGGLEPSDLGYGTNLAANSKDKYDPYATLNLNTNTGLKLYAEGGPVSFADGGMPDPAGLPGGGSDAMQGAGMLPLDVSDINAKYGYNPRDTLTPEPHYPMGIGKPSYTMGIGQPQNVMGMQYNPSVSVTPPMLGLFADNDQIEAARSAYESQLAAAMSGRGGMGSTPNAAQIGQQARQSSGPMGMQTTTSGIGGLGSTAKTADTAPTAETALSRLNLNKTYANGGTIQSGGLQDLYATSDNPTMNPSLSRDGYGLGRLQQLADGGVAGYAKGGYLDGPGDGMSDSIPATIEGKQPARLADGEFVIPADVVSHLGNGSTKAGSQRLYGMLDKVRKARTGTKKQGKQIKPEKYMPA